MPVFHTKSKREEYRLVGASLPLEIHGYITLYTLARGFAKSTILKTLLEHWIAQERLTYPDEELIMEAIRRVKLQWEMRKVRDKISYKQFLVELKEELTKKGLDEKYINMILKGL